MTRWIAQEDGAFWECSNCKLGWFFDSGTPEENELNYCPKCGCKVTEFVREEREGE